ncbi:hypothetical protein P9112_007556 [Eukaryota sp. TZLM1-RC]
MSYYVPAQPMMMPVVAQPMMVQQPQTQIGFAEKLKQQQQQQKKKGCCYCFCTLFCVVIVLFVVGLVLKLGQCSNLQYSRDWMIDDVSQGFDIRSMKGSFQTIICETCTLPELYIVQRNSRDVFPEPNTNTTDETGIYKFAADESHLNWFMDCYTTDVTLYVPSANVMIPYIKIDYDIGLIPDEDFGHKDSIHMDVDLEVPHFDLIVRKESALIEKLVTQRVSLDTTVKATLTLKDINSNIKKECKVKTNFGTQSLDATFAPGTTGFDIKMTSGTGNVKLTLNNQTETGGKLKVVREQNGDGKPFDLNDETFTTPHEKDWGGQVADENNVSIEVSSRMEPGRVSVNLKD